MRLNNITLKDFKIFKGEHKFVFKDVNIITGDNGVGKSALIKDSILFLLYGYSTDKLAKLPNKHSNNNKCCVEGVFDELTIKREVPTKITILKEGIELDLATNADKNKYLSKKFKDIDYFRKFRMIDLTEGINILEEGKKGFIKALFSFHKDYLNSIRDNLATKKREREIYNKDNIPYKIYPSEKRLAVIKRSIADINETTKLLSTDITDLEKKYFNTYKKVKEKEAHIDFFKKKRSNILKHSECPVCMRGISSELKNSLVNEWNTKIKESNEIISMINSNLYQDKEFINFYKGNKTILCDKWGAISHLKSKLEIRIKQKDYKWTKKDVLIIKRAIEELDSFSNSYIRDWIKILEPIINDIIVTIGFEVCFKLDDKGNIDIKLIKDGLEYGYKELSNGQKLILSIAFQLALLLEKGESGLIIADEGLSCLDENNLDHILELFKNVPFQLLCVIHRFAKTPDGIGVINL